MNLYNQKSNKFSQALLDYAKAMKSNEPEIANNTLERYIRAGDLERSQADLIKEKFGPQNDENEISTNIKKPLANTSKITLRGLKNLPPRQYIIKRFEIERGTLALLCASGSSGKSMLIQYIGCCVSSGKKLFGKFETCHGSVVHIDQEQNEIQTQRRYERLASGLEIMQLDIERIDLNRRLDSDKQIENSEQELLSLFDGKDLILIDSLKATSEADENSPQIEIVLKMLKRVAAKTETAIILIHHKGKNTISTIKQTGRGHSSIFDSVDIQLDLEWDLTTETAELSCKKNRDGKSFAGIRYRLLDTGDFNKEQNCSEKLEFELIEDVVTKKTDSNQLSKKVLAEVQDSGSLNLKDLYEKVKGDRNLFNDTVDNLVEQGFLEEKRGLKNARIFQITEVGIGELGWSK